MASHAIEALNPLLIRCLCGWIYRIESPSLWGRQSALDANLDAYNLHKKRPQKKSGPGRDEE